MTDFRIESVDTDVTETFYFEADRDDELRKLAQWLEQRRKLGERTFVVEAVE